MAPALWRGSDESSVSGALGARRSQTIAIRPDSGASGLYSLLPNTEAIEATLSAPDAATMRNTAMMFASVRAVQLPLASQSVDLVTLPHVLEGHEHPHEVLREAERVLVPEGHIVISGFNTGSLWRLRQMFTGSNEAPWDLKFIGLLRLRDWLRVLGFELNGGKFGCYAPPFRQKLWLDRFAFMEKAGARWWPIAGGVYVVRAVKRTHGMRLITPTWRQERARRRARLSALAQPLFFLLCLLGNVSLTLGEGVVRFGQF